MNGAFGFLRWTPEVFWACTLTEYFAAVEGHNAANGGEKAVESPSDEDMARLLAKYG